MRPLHGKLANAVLSWLAVAAALAFGARGVLEGRLLELVFAGSVAVVALAPAIVLESRRAALPWEVSALAVAPLAGAALAPDPFVRQVTLYAGASVLALALTLEIHALTEVRLERWLAASFVTMLSAAIAATWATAAWLRDHLAGTSIVPGNDWAMWLFVAAVGAGLLAGTAFDRYYRRFPGEELVSAPVDGIRQEALAARTGADDYPTLEERLPPSPSVQRGLAWAMRGGLVAMVAHGLVAFDTQLLTNAGAMLVVTFVPTALRRRYDLPFDAGLTLWLVGVVFLHALGSAYLYERTFWWHNVTHPLSATLIGAVGYVVIRTLDAHRDDVHLPPALLPAFVVLFAVALGVFWEIGEFAFDRLAVTFGLTMPVSQYGLDDTMTDLVFDAVGAVIVARWGLPYLSPLTAAIADRLEGWPVVDRPVAPWRDA